jgi:hypothetical protein
MFVVNRCNFHSINGCIVNLILLQTMNKVFEHAGDLVNIKVAHNLMRLIAEGFGVDDEGADSQLRSSAVCTLNLEFCCNVHSVDQEMNVNDQSSILINISASND